MAYPKHLKNAPITEAVLNILVEPDAALVETTLDEFSRRAGQEFPERRPVKQFEASYNIEEDTASTLHRQIGNIYWNVGNSRAIQARNNGFTVNHVRSYESWDVLVSQARQWWSVYLEAVRPGAVTHCGLRFINRFDINHDHNLSYYLRSKAELAPGLPQSLDEYFLRLGVPFPTGERAVIAQLIERPNEPSDKPSLVLDIDVSINVRLEPASAEVWEVFERLRVIKNQCFFESLRSERWEDFQ